LDKAKGALIASVSDNGPAQAAGIQAGDVVLSFDGRDVNDMRRLPRLVAETPVGKTVPLTLWRKRRENTVQVMVGRLEESERQLERRKRAKYAPKLVIVHAQAPKRSPSPRSPPRSGVALGLTPEFRPADNPGRREGRSDQHGRAAIGRSRRRLVWRGRRCPSR